MLKAGDIEPGAFFELGEHETKTHIVKREQINTLLARFTCHTIEETERSENDKITNRMLIIIRLVIMRFAGKHAELVPLMHAEIGATHISPSVLMDSLRMLCDGCNMLPRVRQKQLLVGCRSLRLEVQT